MTRFIQRLAKTVGQETYKIHIRIISLHIPLTSELFNHLDEKSISDSTEKGLMGIYFKVKRGNNRMIGKHRYAAYKSGKDSEDVVTILIDETFEQRSVFFKN